MILPVPEKSMIKSFRSTPTPLQDIDSAIDRPSFQHLTKAFLPGHVIGHGEPKVVAGVLFIGAYELLTLVLSFKKGKLSLSPLCVVMACAKV